MVWADWRTMGGTFSVIDASPRDDASANVIRAAFTAVRVDEWAEFVADCGKFEVGIEREISKAKYTFGELEEEEQSLDRLRRWFRELKRRDALALPDAETAEERLNSCENTLKGYAERVYQVMQADTRAVDPPRVTER